MSDEQKTGRLAVLVLAFVFLALAVILTRGANGEEDQVPTAPELLEQMIYDQQNPAPGKRFWTDVDETGHLVSTTPDAKAGRIPFDDSDPMMQQYAEQFFAQRCNRGPGLRCPEAKAPLQAGGAQLARYLIDHYQRSKLEGYRDTATLLTAIAGTETPTGTTFVIGLVDNPGDRQEFEFALAALRECRSSVAVDRAMSVLDHTPESDSLARTLAIQAIEVNVDEAQLSRGDVVDRLRAIAVRERVNDFERGAAIRALRTLGE
jgi:hypothetical protein